MAVPEMANVPRMCVSACDSEVLYFLPRRPRCLEPGKKEPVQTLILGSHKQQLTTDKYGLGLCSSEALSLPALSLTFFFFLHAGFQPMGAYFWLKHN